MKKMISRRTFLKATAGVATLSAFAACSSSDTTTSTSTTSTSTAASTTDAADETANDEIEPGAVIAMMGGSSMITVTEIALRGFMEQYPDITFSFEKYSYAEYPTKMKLAFGTGEPVPDMVLVHGEFARPYIDAGYFLDVTDMYDAENSLPMHNIVTVDGHCYGLVNQATNQYVYIYREDLYAELGLEPPKTFDEYFEQALIMRENGYYAGGYDPSTSSIDMFRRFTYLLGGEILNDDGEVVFSKAEEAITLIEQCYNAGIFYPAKQSNAAEYWSAFNSGLIAGFHANGAEAANYETNIEQTELSGYGSLAIADMPVLSADAPKIVLNDISYFAINKNTLYPNAARKVLEYLTQSVEGALAFSNVDEDGTLARYGTAYIPGLEAIASGEDAAGWAAYGDKTIASQYAQMLLDAGDDIVVPYVDSKSAEIITIVDEVLGDMFMNGAYTPAQAAAEMVSRANSI